MAAKKAAKKGKVVEVFTPDAFVIRTSKKDGEAYGGFIWKKDGEAYGGFIWKKEIDAIVEAPDWEPTTKCGNGLHGLLDGVGDWGLLSGAHDALYWVIGVKREECISIGTDKVKFPRGQVVYFGGLSGALSKIAESWREVAIKAAGEPGTEAKATTGNYAHSATTGYSAHSATTGKQSVAVALGYNNRAKASEGGAIVLTKLNRSLEIVAIRASKVGENGVQPDKWYELNEAGEFVEVDE